MSLAAKQAFACWIAALLLSVAALFAFLGSPGSPGGAGEAIGRLFAHTGIAALLCWVIARKKLPPWSWARFALVYAAVFIVLAVVANAGTARAIESSATASSAASSNATLSAAQLSH